MARRVLRHDSRASGLVLEMEPEPVLEPEPEPEVELDSVVLIEDAGASWVRGWLVSVTEEGVEV
jgi:hypothetical protein